MRCRVCSAVPHVQSRDRPRAELQWKHRAIAGRLYPAALRVLPNLRIGSWLWTTGLSQRLCMPTTLLRGLIRTLRPRASAELSRTLHASRAAADTGVNRNCTCTLQARYRVRTCTARSKQSSASCERPASVYPKPVHTKHRSSSMPCVGEAPEASLWSARSMHAHARRFPGTIGRSGSPSQDSTSQSHATVKAAGEKPLVRGSLRGAKLADQG